MGFSHSAARSPVLAGLRSVVIPGWGELSVTGARFGRALVLLSLAVANIALGALVFLGPLEVLSGLINPGSLLALLAVNTLVAVARLMSTGHAWWLAGGRSLVVAMLLGVLVMSPHLAAGWLTLQVRETVMTVFSPTPPPAQVAALPPFERTTTPASTTLPTPPTSAGHGSAMVDMSAPSETAPGPLGQRLNLVILGGDAGPGRGGLRTDTVMVASVNVKTGDTAIFGLPRNLGELHLADGTPVPGRILNEVYGWASRDRADHFPGIDPGAVAVADVAAYLTGLKIDHFVLVDLTGFADIVDAFGGVTLRVPVPVDGPLYDTVDGSYTMVRIPVGEQTMDGDHALAYARARYGSSDYVRMGRQRCILAAMVGQLDLFSTLVRLPRLLDVVERNVTTSLPVDLAPDLVRLATRIRDGDVRVIGFGPDWSLGVNESGQLVPDVARIREAVGETLRDPGRSVAPSAVEACA
jgi:polyisoprenyl-teichoic acid--peptidoglycan teichoic acid transferase